MFHDAIREQPVHDARAWEDVRHIGDRGSAGRPWVQAAITANGRRRAREEGQQAAGQLG